MWKERLDKKFRDQVPHVVKDLHGEEGEYFACENVSLFPVAAIFAAGVESARLSGNKKKAWIRLLPVWDPASRIKDQDCDGVVAGAIYTSMGMPF